MFERKVSQYEECVDRIVKLHANMHEPIFVHILLGFHCRILVEPKLSMNMKFRLVYDGITRFGSVVVMLY